MTPAMMSDDKPQSVYATSRKESPLLFEGLTWREFKAVEHLLDRPGYRLSFLDRTFSLLNLIKCDRTFSVQPNSNAICASLRDATRTLFSQRDRTLSLQPNPNAIA